MIERFQKLWCRMFHRRAMWPANGMYRCATCLQEFPVLWSELEPQSSDGVRSGFVVSVRISEFVVVSQAVRL